MTDVCDVANEYADRMREASLARRQRFEGESLTHCEECETEIPLRRQELLPGVRLCVDCQALAEAR